MSKAIYEVIDPNGVLYPERGRDGGKAVSLPIGAKIREIDVEKGNFTLGGLESLEKNGRVKPIDELSGDNKKAPKSQKKGGSDEE